MVNPASLVLAAAHRRKPAEAGHSRLVKRMSTRKRAMQAIREARGDGWYARLMELLESLALQTILYLSFVLIFQMLASSLRAKEEYYLDKKMMEDIVEEEFDSSHNTFESIRRIADVYEWGNRVLWPALFGMTDSCNPSATGSRVTPKGCNDFVWPDGEGPFGTQTPTGFRVDEAVRMMDLLDWTEGVVIRQMRAGPMPCRSSQLERQTAEELIAAGFVQPAGGPSAALYSGGNAARVRRGGQRVLPRADGQSAQLG